MTSSLESEDHTVWDYSFIIELPIDRPARDVWPHFIGKRKDVWTGSDYMTVAGEPGEAGELFTHAHKFNGVPVFYEAISVEPQKHWVLKITCGDGNEGSRRLIGYDFHTFDEADGHTVFWFHQALALPRSLIKEEFSVATERQNRRLTELFQKLKAVIEAGK